MSGDSLWIMAATTDDTHERVMLLGELVRTYHDRKAPLEAIQKHFDNVAEEVPHYVRNFKAIRTAYQSIHGRVQASPTLDDAGRVLKDYAFASGLHLPHEWALLLRFATEGYGLAVLPPGKAYWVVFRTLKKFMA